MPDKNTVSMIHPNMYNGALKRAGIEGITVKDGDNGLVVEYGLSGISDVLGKLVEKLLEADVIYNMVLPSNVSKLREISGDLSDLLNLAHFDSENREWADAELEMLDSVIANLKDLPNA
jgi:hypothetical protein